MKKKYKGEWFLPNNRDVRLPGILEIDTSNPSILLKLYSHIDFDGKKIPYEREGGFKYPEIVLGNVNDLHSDVTLYSHRGGGYHIIENPIHKELFESIYQPRVAFINKHFFSKEEILFKSFSFRYTYLGDWIDAVRPWFFKVEWIEDKFMLGYKRIPDFELVLSQNCKLKIKRECSIKGPTKSEDKMTLKHFVEFEFANQQPLDEFYNLSEKIQTFLFFAIGIPVELIENYPENNRTDSSVEIFTDFIKEPAEIKWHHPTHMPLWPSLFSEDDLKKYLYNWFQFYDEFQAVFDTFSQAVKPFWKPRSLTVSNLEFSNGILNIVQAIETFFKRDKDIDYQKIKAEFTLKRNSIFGKIKKKADDLTLSDEDVEFLNKNLTLPNKENYPFKKTISFFLSQLKNALSGFIDENEHEIFSQNLKECRNTLTHINHTNVSDVAKQFDLPYLFYHSQIIFCAITYKKMGLTEPQINEILKRSKQFGRYFRQNDKN